MGRSVKVGEGDTPWKFNSSPEKFCHPKRKGGNVNFQGCILTCDIGGAILEPGMVVFSY